MYLHMESFKTSPNTIPNSNEKKKTKENNNFKT